MLASTLDIVGGGGEIKIVEKSLPLRSLSRLLNVVTCYISDGIRAIHSGAPSSLSRLCGDVSKFLGHLQESLDEGFSCTFDHQDILRITLPGLTHLRGKEGTGTFFKAPSLVASGGGSGRWDGGQIPGGHYWQHCTAIPEKLKQLRERGLSSLSF